MYQIANSVRVKVIFLYIYISLGLKVCHCNKSESRQQENMQAISTGIPVRIREKFEDGQYTTYFRHEPFGPQSYSFGFEVQDIKTGNRQFRDERRYVNGTVEGSYGYVRPDGCISITHYIADGIRGYLSQTRTLEKGDLHTSDQNWRMHFLTTGNQQNLTENNDVDRHSVTSDHIDLEKDVIKPTLWALLNESLTQVGNNASEAMSFQNVLPNHFPLVPFELPKKLKNRIQSNENQLSSESESRAEENIKNSTESSNEEVEPLDLSENLAVKSSNKSEGGGDWITTYFSQARKEFVET